MKYVRRIIPLALIWTAAVAGAQPELFPAPPPAPIVRRANEDALLSERARRAEGLGDYTRALLLWQELLSRNPWNPEAVQGATRAFLVTKRYDEGEAFLQDLLRKSALRPGPPPSPLDPTSPFALQLARGTLALARGDEPRAWEIWNAALTETGRSPDAVRAFVTVLQQNRRYEESERLIRETRKQLGQNAFMALELAFSLRSQMNFAAATEELLLYAASVPSGWQAVISYLMQFPDDSAAAAKVYPVLRKAVQRDRRNADLWRIFAAYTHKIGRPEESLDATIAADSLTGGTGALILQAAQQMLAEGEIDVARRGFQKLIAWQLPPDMQAQAELGLGRCLEMLGQYGAARAAYEAFVTRHAGRQAVDEARLRIAEILLAHERRPAEALTILRELWPRSQAVSRATVGLRIGDCHAHLGELAEAISAWREVARMGGRALNEEAAQALLRVARANLWRDSTRQALDVLDSIQKSNPVFTAFNDAVLYTALLSEGGFHRAVRAFAEGDWAAFRGEDSLAAVRFGEAAGLLKRGRLAEWALYSEAVALRAAGKAQMAVTVLDSFLVRFPESVDFDRARFTRAMILADDLQQEQAALEELKRFLAEHPRSLYLEPARRKARALDARLSAKVMKKAGA